MTPSQDITVVVQGNIRDETAAALLSVRRLLPRAHVVLSTYEDERLASVHGLADEVVKSRDPGTLPGFTLSREADPSNLNRQLVSTQAGLARVRMPYTLKLRSDCLLESDAFRRIFDNVHRVDPQGNRLLVSTFFTRHPRGLACYPFHVSDWFVFGRTERVRALWDVPLMSLSDATWFEHHRHKLRSTATAKRFRARYSPEQYVGVHFARRMGYVCPEFLDDTSVKHIDEYIRFLSREFIVAEPRHLGIRLPKYDSLSKSLYLRIDCVAMSDWLDFFRSEVGQVRDMQALHDLRRCASHDHGLRQLRWAAHLGRHAVVRLMLMRKALQKRLRQWRAT